MIHKIVFENRNYDTWTIFDVSSLEPIHIPNFNPLNHKLFTNDTFTYVNNTFTLIHSAVKTTGDIPAVLILADNKSYGRKKTKVIYKCIPDDKRIPIFFVPYEIKHLGFSKVVNNMYVVIQYDKWIDKHPHGSISHTIGNVNILDNFYEYQLYCKSLNASIQKFNKATINALNNNNNESHETIISTICRSNPTIQDRTMNKVFTIDPASSLDYDDAFSIHSLPNNKTKISIYIANVTILLDALKLWSSFSKRISTIYLPTKKRPMLPTVLSDCLCSLQANRTRFAFVMDVIVAEDYSIDEITYANCVITVHTNFAYEEPKLHADLEYKQLFETVTQLSRKYKYLNNVKDSHDIVCYLMIFMNYHCANNLLKYKNGIFRSTIVNPETIQLPKVLPDNVSKFILNWNNTCGQYIDIRTTELTRHDNLELDAYVHITSPIRRLVDLLYIIKFQQNHQLIELSNDANIFYDTWINNIDYINTTTRAIRKIQNDCHLLHECHTNPIILSKVYDGFCFDKMSRSDGLYQYNIFLPELKLASKIVMRNNYDNFAQGKYKLYLFNNEETFKKKIRLHVVNDDDNSKV